MRFLRTLIIIIIINIFTNISEPIFYQPKLEGENKKALHQALRTVAS